jgi:N-acetylglucosaminyl-diphospho-decaprenol L-rhamnosyltransferase
MSFTAVVVIHDSARHVEALLQSVARELADDPPQVVVVDSGSRDDGAAVARAHGAEVHVLDGNPGFGAASNAGLDHARHDVCVLLNPDCELIDGSLAALAARARIHDALLVPRLLNADRTLQRSAHPLPGRASALVPALWPPRAMPRSLRDHFEPWRASAPRPVGWAIAACVAARTDLLRALGPFDPAAFLFYEDLELCLHARAAGIPTELRPEVRLIHHGGHATGPALGTRALDLQARRRRAVIGARLGPRALRLDDAAQALTFGARALAGRRRTENLAELRSLRRAGDGHPG